MDAESYTLDGLSPSVCNVEGRAQTDDLKLDGPGQLWTVYGAKADGHESKLTVIRIVDGPNQSRFITLSHCDSEVQPHIGSVHFDPIPSTLDLARPL